MIGHGRYHRRSKHPPLAALSPSFSISSGRRALTIDGIILTPETGPPPRRRHRHEFERPTALAAYQAELGMLANEGMHSAMRGDKMGAGWWIGIDEVALNPAMRVSDPHDVADRDAHLSVCLPLAFNRRRNGPFETA